MFMTTAAAAHHHTIIPDTSGTITPDTTAEVALFVLFADTLVDNNRHPQPPQPQHRYTSEQHQFTRSDDEPFTSATSCTEASGIGCEVDMIVEKAISHCKALKFKHEEYLATHETVTNDLLDISRRNAVPPTSHDIPLQ